MKIEENKWKILIVDDEEFIHDNLEMNLEDLIYDNKNIRFLHAFSAKEAKDVLLHNPDIAIIILDVMMEENNSGLNFVKLVRQEIKNQDVRIILHTGQPGIAPKKEVSQEYIIDGYLDKNISDNDDCYVAIRIALRSYQEKLRLREQVIADDATILEDIAKEYILFVKDKNYINDYEEVMSKINYIVHLAQKIMISYTLIDLKNNLPQGSTKQSRLSYDDYNALVQIHDIKYIMTYSCNEEFQKEKSIILDAIIKVIKKFSTIKILPKDIKDSLNTAITSFEKLS